jgi:chromosome segregation ATPase
MKFNKKFVITSLFCFFLSLNSTSFAKEERDQLANAFIQHGIIRAERGDVSGALEDFSQALILNPRNQKAENSLLSLASSKEVSSADRQSIQQINDMINYRHNLEGRVQYFQYKRDFLGSELVKKGFSAAMLDAEIAKRHYLYLASASPADKSEFISRGAPLKSVTNALESNINDLEKQAQSLAGQVEILRKMYQSSDNDSSQLASYNFQPYAEQKDQIQEVNPNVSQKNDIVYLQQDELSQMNQKLDEIHRVVSEKEDRILRLTEKITDLTLHLAKDGMNPTLASEEVSKLRTDLAEIRKKYDASQMFVSSLETQIDSLKSKSSKNGSPITNIDEMAKLNDQIDELHSRVELNQKIILDKDAQIKELETRLSKSAAYPSKHSQTNLSEMEGLLKTYDENIKGARDLIEKKDQQIKILEGKLAKTSMGGSDEMAAFNAYQLAKDEELMDLKMRLVETEEKLDDAQKLIEKKDKKIASLAKRSKKNLSPEMDEDQGIIEIQSLLVETTQNLTAAKLTIEEQSKKISSLETELAQSQEVAKMAEINGFNQYKIATNQTVNTLTDTLNMYRMGLSQALISSQEKDRLITNLTQQLNDLQKDLTLAQNAVEGKERKIEMIRESVNQEKSRIEENNDLVRQMISSKDKELQELGGVLDIYRGKLSDAKLEIENSKGSIVGLEQQLASAQVRLSEKDMLLQKTKDNLSNLEKQLMDIQDRLLQLKGNSSGTMLMPSPTQEDPIQNIQLDIQELQTFIHSEVNSLEKLNLTYLIQK